MVHFIKNLLVGATEYFKYVFGLTLLLFKQVEILIWGVVILILMDQITGVALAISTKRFRWKKFNSLYMKVVLYFVCLVAAFVLDDVILEAGKLVEARSHYICKGTAGVMGVHELASIFRNTARATGKRYLEDYIKRKIQ